MKIVIAALAGLFLATPAYAQPPAQDTPEEADVVNPKSAPVRQIRPTHVVCETTEGGVVNPVVRMCPLPPDAPWPAPPKAKPKSGLFPLDQS